MKKTALFLAALLSVIGIGFATMPQASHAEDAAKSVMCPTCKIAIPTSDKPVLGMLEGKKHTCSACKNEYDQVAGKTTHVCAHCGGTVDVCPACGNTELVPKA